jgi:hypothetical protein
VFVLFGASLAGFALSVRLPRSPDDFGRLMGVEVDLAMDGHRRIRQVEDRFGLAS